MATVKVREVFERIGEANKQLQQRLPPLLASDARNYFLDTFQKQAWENRSWSDVKRRTDPQRYKSKPYSSSASRPILLGYGNLRKAVSNSIVRQIWPSVRLVVDMRKMGFKDNYAYYLNTGTPTMSPRKFMGDSPGLRKVLQTRIKNEFDKAYK